MFIITPSNAIENSLLDLPPPRRLPISEDPEWIHDHETECFPFMLVADDAFPLKPQIMKPYSHRNLDDKKLLFNYQASRYRRIIENAFGILSCRFRLFLARTYLSPESAIDLVLAAVTLHNMLRTKSVIHTAPQKFLMKKSISKLCVQDPGGVIQAQVCLQVCKVADKTTAIPKMLKKSEMD